MSKSKTSLREAIGSHARETRRRINAAAMVLYVEALPWFRQEITERYYKPEAASLSNAEFAAMLASDDRQFDKSILQRAEQEWSERTGRPALRTVRDWFHAGIAAGFPVDKFYECDVHIFLDSIVGWAIELIRASRPACSVPNTQVVFSGREPTPDVKDLAHKLNNRGKRSKIDVARKFTNGNERKANSLLAQIARLERKRRLRFEPRSRPNT